MEELLATQLAELREEQEQLEQKLGHNALGVPRRTWSTPATESPTKRNQETHRCVRELTAEEAVRTTAASFSAGPADTINDGYPLGTLPHDGMSASQGGSSSPVPDTVGGVTRARWSYEERLGEMESLRRKYESYAREAMNRYFISVNDYQGYRKRRDTQKIVKPFSFEARELIKPQRIREQRAEQERQAREAAETGHDRNPYKATPVPPSTFMNKYALMVEEWCQRKAAIEMMSRERASIAKKESAYVRLSAQGLRSTREELMGVVYGPDGNPLTRNELRRRAQSAHTAEGRRKGVSASLREVPLEVRMKLWPALSDHQRVRNERIKFLATLRKSEVDAEVRQVMPLLSSPSPARHTDAADSFGANIASLLAAVSCGSGGEAAPHYGVGQAVLSSNPVSVPAAAGGAVAGTPVPSVMPPPPAAAGVSASPLLATVPPPPPTNPAPPMPPGLATVAPLPVPSSSISCVVPPPPVTVPQPIVSVHPPSLQSAPAAVADAPLPPSCTPGAFPAPPLAASTTSPAPAAHLSAPASSVNAGAPAAVKGVRRKTEKNAEAAWRRYNPHLTFTPNVRPGVPNFEALWAQHNAELAEKKKKHPTTVPRPFDLTPTVRDSKIVGRRPVRSVSAFGPPRRHRSPSSGKTRPVAGAPPMPANSATGPQSPLHGAPRGTRAHALRTEAIYSHYVKQSEDRTATAEGDEEFWKAVAQRRREVRKRLSAYLVDHHAEHERAITKRVRALRAAMRESERAAKERLTEMRQRVSEMPPVFAEPVQLNDQSKARAAVERGILQSLRETGLDGATIRNIIASSPSPATDTALDAAGSIAAGTVDGGGQRENDASTADGEQGGSKQGEASPGPVARSSLSELVKAPKRGSSDSSSSSSSDSDDSISSSSSNSSSSNSSSHSTVRISLPGSSTRGGSSRPSLSVISVPVPKSIETTKKVSVEYSDDSFESSDSD